MSKRRRRNHTRPVPRSAESPALPLAPPGARIARARQHLAKDPRIKELSGDRLRVYVIGLLVADAQGRMAKDDVYAACLLPAYHSAAELLERSL